MHCLFYIFSFYVEQTRLNVCYDSVTLERFGRTGARFTFVRNLVIESVRPDRYLQWRDSYATVIYISEVLEHLVLRVATRFQVRRSHTNDLASRDITEVLQYLTHSDHLAHPLLVTFVFQPFLESENICLRQRNNSDVSQVFTLLTRSSRSQSRDRHAPSFGPYCSCSTRER